MCCGYGFIWFQYSVYFVKYHRVINVKEDCYVCVVGFVVS